MGTDDHNTTAATTGDYRCPGQHYPISRAIHLARLAAFYPACRQCDHRYDTGTLSARKVDQLATVAESRAPRSLFHDEGAGGVYLNDLTPATAYRIAAAFGLLLTYHNEGQSSLLPPSSLIPHPASVVLAGDGRSLTAELVAAACEGLRITGCEVIDIGPATAACLAFAVAQSAAAAGLLIGNPSNDPHTAGLTFWAKGGLPISSGDTLEGIRLQASLDISRPTRSFGNVRHLAAEEPYLESIAQYYHALRPLRVIVDSASQPLFDYLQQLTARVACDTISSRVARQELPLQIREDRAHFAIHTDGDGETCRVWDEQGRAVAPEQLLQLLTSRVTPPATVVLEADTTRDTATRLEQAGLHVVRSDSRRSAMATSIQESHATLGGGPSGRFWFADLGLPLPDALMVITSLLIVLSRSDAPLSQVLDQFAPAK